MNIKTGDWIAQLDSLADSCHEELVGKLPPTPSWKVSYSIENGVAWGFVAELGCHEDTEKNAHLISAAPDMFNILLEMVDYSSEVNNGSGLIDDDKIWEKVDRALAKARGETNE